MDAEGASPSHLGLRVHLLGGFRVERAGALVPAAAWLRRDTARTLVKLLALEPGHRLHREQIIDTLWPEIDVEAAGSRLRKTLHAARHALEPNLPARGASSYLDSAADVVTLKADAMWIDVDEFEALTESGLKTRDIATLEAACRIYVGDLLPEDRYADWAAGRREWLAERSVQILLALADALEARGAYEAAVERLQQALLRDATREDVHRQLMRVYLRAGSRHHALRQYQICREILHRELAVDPEPATEALHDQILADDTGPSAERAPAGVVLTDVRVELPPALRRVTTLHASSPFVGRERVLEHLQGELENSRNGRGMTVIIGGEAGVGKTRLTAELARPAWDQGMLVLWGAGQEHGGLIPYAPFIEAIEGYVTSATARMFDEERAQCHQALLERYPELTSLLPSLATANPRSEPPLPGADDAGERTRLFGGITRFLGDVSSRRPLLLVLDDVHCVDAASIQLLHHLARQAPDRCWLIVGTYREEDVPTAGAFAQFSTAATREGICHRIDLRALARDDCNRLVTGLMEFNVQRSTFNVGNVEYGVASAATVKLQEEIYQRTLGNPLFATEIVRALQEDGESRGTERSVALDGLAPEPDTWNVERGTWNSPRPSVPRQVRELIGTRLDRMPDDVRSVLALAAAMGMESSFPILRHAATGAFHPPFDEPRLLNALDGALEARVLEERQVAGSWAYAFRHPLWRETIYSRLSRHRRAQLHAELARAIEAQRPHEVEEIAHHYRESMDDVRAVVYLERAGDRARSIYANEASAAYYRHTIDRLTALGRHADLARVRVKLGSVLVTLARYEEAVEVLDAAIHSYRCERDTERLVRATTERIAALGAQGQVEAALQLGHTLAQELEGVADADVTGVARAALALEMSNLHFSRGDYELAQARSEEVVSLLRDTADDADDVDDADDKIQMQLLVRAQCAVGTVQAMLGREMDAIATLTSLIPKAEAIDDLVTLSQALSNLGADYANMGELGLARAYLERALETTERLGDPTKTGWGHSVLGNVVCLLGDWKSAREHFERALAMLDAVGSRWTPYPLCQLGSLDQCEGREDDARCHVEEAIARAGRTGDLQVLRWAHITLAEGDLMTGNASAAIERLEPLLDRTGHKELDVTYVLPVLARAHVETAGSPEQRARARALVAESVERAREHHHLIPLIDALRAMGTLAGRTQEWGTAEQCFCDALRLTQEMSARYAEAQTRYDHAMVALQRGELDRARVQLDAAQTIFERLGAAPYLARTQAARSLVSTGAPSS